MVEKPGTWFFPPLASLITSAGRLLLAMTEACVQEKQGTYLFCDTDSLAIVAAKNSGSLNIPGSEGVRILSWAEVQEIVDRFIALNPYDPKAVKGSISQTIGGIVCMCCTDVHTCGWRWGFYSTASGLS